MTVLVCRNCNSKVRSPKCHETEMDLRDTELFCAECGNSVEVNHCCGKPMGEKKE